MAVIIDDTGTRDLFLVSEPTVKYGLEDDWILGLDGEDFIVTGAGNDVLDGGIGADQLSGGEGSDTIVAGAGDDTVYADAGNDIYYGGSGNDALSFICINWGALKFFGDANVVGVRVDLAVTSAQNLGVFGIDRIFGFENLAGGTGNDTFYGSSADNRLLGLEGDDILYGRAGNDTLMGGVGADTLVGGIGTDLIYAINEIDLTDTSRDVIRYLALNESGTPKDVTTWDTIFGFKHGQDKLDLSAIDADISRAGNQAFTLVKTFTGAYGEVHLKKDGTDMLVEIDGARNTGIDMVIRVADVSKLDKSDFIL